MVERILVDAAPLLRIFEQRFDLGRKRDPAVVNAVVERLHADPIADQPEAPFTSVPERDREHAAEPVQAVDAPFLERVQDHFGIGVARLPPVSAERLELLAHLRVIVDLAVEDHLQPAVFVGHRLVGHRREIDDRQAAVTEAHPAVRRHPDAAAVRATMSHRVAHPADVRLGEDERRLIERNAADDAAHQISRFSAPSTSSAIEVACSCSHSAMGDGPPCWMARANASSSSFCPFSGSRVLNGLRGAPLTVSDL